MSSGQTPPYDSKLIEKLLDIFVNRSLTGYIVTPMKLRNTRLNDLIREAAEAVILLDKSPHIFTPSSTAYKRSVGPTPWTTQVAVFNTGIPRLQESIKNSISAKKQKAAKHCRSVLRDVTDSCVTIFTDGSSLGNPGPAGAAAICCVPNANEAFVIREPLGEHTNNLSELWAIWLALNGTKIETVNNYIRNKNSTIHIFTDSEYAFNIFTGRISPRSYDKMIN